MCTGTPSAGRPRALSASAVSAHASGFRDATTTVAPARARPSAMARPIPLVPTVTMATRPSREKREVNFARSMMCRRVGGARRSLSGCACASSVFIHLRVRPEGRDLIERVLYAQSVHDRDEIDAVVRVLEGGPTAMRPGPNVLE